MGSAGLLICSRLRSFKRAGATQGNRLSCRDQEGRTGSDEAVPGLSVFPRGYPARRGLKLRLGHWGKKEGLRVEIMASGPITSWEIDGETMETVTDFIFLGSKITGQWTVIAAMKLKNICFLEEKL